MGIKNKIIVLKCGKKDSNFEIKKHEIQINCSLLLIPLIYVKTITIQ
jgi:hypothetical protein